MYSHSIHSPLLKLLLLSSLFFTTTTALPSSGGRWQLLQQNLGIVAMHMQLLHNDRVVIYDRTDFGPSNLNLTLGKCRLDPHDQALTRDCTAHSVEYDVASNTFRPLDILTDVWCSSGSVTPDGLLIQTGGFNDGERVVRTFNPCNDDDQTASSVCDWLELGDRLLARRWYSTNHILPNGNVIVVGGRRSFNYEFFPKSEASRSGLYRLDFLAQTKEPKVENNLYPFVLLNVDGNLFIFANTKSILFDYTRNAVVRTYPELPGEARCYPSTGSTVLLPLRSRPDSAEVLVCGGAPKDAYTQAAQGKFLEASNTCGRITITDPNPEWAIETMPMPRVMGDMLLLPNGRILIINGAGSGSAGWEYARNPVLAPVIYDPVSPPGSRFVVQAESEIPRMYHSSTILLRDGRVLVGGSNPHVGYSFDGVNYPTELRLEAYLPSYLDDTVASLRPGIVSPGRRSKIGYGETMGIRFRVTGLVDPSEVAVTMIMPPFNTHSFSMSQRLLVLGSVANVTAVGGSEYDVAVEAPMSVNVAPKGYYLLFVVHRDIPSEGVWVQVQ